MKDVLEMQYFVLNPKSSDAAHRKASIEGMRAYATAISGTRGRLAGDIRDWARHCDQLPLPACSAFAGNGTSEAIPVTPEGINSVRQFFVKGHAQAHPTLEAAMQAKRIYDASEALKEALAFHGLDAAVVGLTEAQSISIVQTLAKSMGVTL